MRLPIIRLVLATNATDAAIEPQSNRLRLSSSGRSKKVSVGQQVPICVYFGRMKLSIVTAFHSRPELTALWGEHTSKFGVPVYAAITEGDAANIATARRHSFTYVEMPNNPVGDKFQAALGMAMIDGAEAIMVLPSDDFISDEWMRKASEGADPYIIPARIAIHGPGQGTYELRTDGRACTRYGAGRVMHRAVVDACGGVLWAAHRNKSLDSESHGRIRAAGFTCKAIATKQIPLVDVKSGTNIWPWRKWRGGGHKCSADQALHMVSPSIRERIAALC